MSTTVSFAIDTATFTPVGAGRSGAAWASDGALVDVNCAPASVLRSIAGLDELTIGQLIEVRETIGGFRSLAEMQRLLELPWGCLRRLHDIAVFHPRARHTAAV